METNAWRVVDPWMKATPTSEGYGVYNIGWPVQCRNPLWAGRIWGTTAASWAVIWPSGNNEPKIPAGLHSLSTPWIKFVRRTLTLTAKDALRVVQPLIWDVPHLDENVWFRRRQQEQKGLPQSLICWGGCDRRMGDQSKEDGFGGQGLILFQIGLWAVQGQFV